MEAAVSVLLRSFAAISRMRRLSVIILKGGREAVFVGESELRSRVTGGETLMSTGADAERLCLPSTGRGDMVGVAGYTTRSMSVQDEHRHKMKNSCPYTHMSRAHHPLPFASPSSHAQNIALSCLALFYSRAYGSVPQIVLLKNPLDPYYGGIQEN